MQAVLLPLHVALRLPQLVRLRLGSLRLGPPAHRIGSRLLPCVVSLPHLVAQPLQLVTHRQRMCLHLG